MPREQRILSVIDGLYGAAMGETPWDAALHGVRQLHDGAVAIVFDLDRRTGAIPRWLSTGTASPFLTDRPARSAFSPFGPICPDTAAESVW